MLAVAQPLMDTIGKNEIDMSPLSPSLALSPSSPVAQQQMTPLEAKKPEKDLNTTIIFDWDDTLLASSFLSAHGFRLDAPLDGLTAEMESHLRQLEKSVGNLLTMAMSCGQTCIITNAETGWVQLSAQKFMPGVVPLLSKVKIVSARSTFEAQFPDSPQQWKFQAFSERLNEVFGSQPAAAEAPVSPMKNVLSFGDSHVEREAVHTVTRPMKETQTKSVKFVERPSIEQLRRQIELVTNCFEYICNHEGDLDLMLTISLFS
jgi:hypothetical protein